jgi:iron-sulfur cluster assembly accessory protein
MLQLTERAAEKVKQLMSAENKQNHALRVAVKGGGCSGFEYGLTFDDSRSETDHVLEFHGVEVLVDGMSRLYLEGVSIDYVDGLEGSGFKIENPNATGTCGCGHSFSV